MHDTFLFNNISETLKDMCKSNKIQYLSKISLAVHHNSHINERNMFEHLNIHCKDIISDDFIVEVLKENIEEYTAIIKSIKGSTYD